MNKYNNNNIQRQRYDVNDSSEKSRSQIYMAVVFQCLSILSIFIGGCVLLLFLHLQHNSESNENDDNYNNHSSTTSSTTITIGTIMNLQYSNTTTSACTNDATIIASLLFLQQLFQQLLGGIFIAYAIGSGLLLLPILYDILWVNTTSAAVDRTSTSSRFTIV